MHSWRMENNSGQTRNNTEAIGEAFSEAAGEAFTSSIAHASEEAHGEKERAAQNRKAQDREALAPGYGRHAGSRGGGGRRGGDCRTAAVSEGRERSKNCRSSGRG